MSRNLLLGAVTAAVLVCLPVGSALAAPKPCSKLCYVSPAGSDSAAGNKTTPKQHIQAAINQASAGASIRVFPGTYNETAPNSAPTSLGGTYQFGLFFPSSKPGIWLVGVTAGDATITKAADIAAVVNTDSTADFGPDGTFVEAANTTIEGLELGPNASGDNKTIEVVANNFTLRACKTTSISGGGSIYINDFSADADVVKGYTIRDNKFLDGTTLDIANGAGNTGPVTGRQILNNTFDGNDTGYASVSFSGTGGPPWFAAPVGGARITGNAFSHNTQFIRARGVYDNSQFNWKSFWTTNTFDHAALALNNTGAAATYDVRTYAYNNGYAITNVRRIGGGTAAAEVAVGGAANTILTK